MIASWKLLKTPTMTANSELSALKGSNPYYGFATMAIL